MDNGSLFDDQSDERDSHLALPAESAAGSPFDAIRHEDEQGEFWTGRELRPLMDYTRWQTFEAVIEKTKKSLALVHGQAVADAAFMQVSQLTQTGNLGDQARCD